MAELENGALPAWGQNFAYAVGVLVLVYLTVKGVIADRRKAREEKATGDTRREANIALKRGRRNGRRIDEIDRRHTTEITRLTASLEATILSQDRQLRTYEAEITDLRRQSLEMAKDHAKEVKDFGDKFIAINNELGKVQATAQMFKEQYDKAIAELGKMRDENTRLNTLVDQLSTRLAKFESPTTPAL